MLKAREDKELDPRVKRTRQLLIKAFQELLGEKDFQAISVQDIAGRATVNRATFYAHFEDKYDLMDYMIRERFEELLYSNLSVRCELALDNLRKFIRVAFEFLAEFHSHCSPSRNKFEPLIEAHVQVLLYEFTLAWFHQQKGNAVPEHPEILASSLSWTIFGAGLDTVRNKANLQEAVEQVLKFISGGVAAMETRPLVTSTSPAKVSSR